MELRVGITGRDGGEDVGRPPLTLLEAPTVPELVLRSALEECTLTPCTRVVEGELLASSSAAGVYPQPPSEACKPVGTAGLVCSAVALPRRLKVSWLLARSAPTREYLQPPPRTRAEEEEGRGGGEGGTGVIESKLAGTSATGKALRPPSVCTVPLLRSREGGSL